MENYKNMFDLTGKIALVAGTGGLGSAIATALVQNGADVAIFDAMPEKAQGILDCAKECGRKAIALSCNITDEAAVEAALDEVKAQLGDVSILVNAVGINKLLPAEDYDKDTFEKVMAVNVTGTHIVTKAVAKKMMLPANYGRIVNISSVKAFIGARQDYIAYCASKGAINMYTKQLACEWGDRGITCNAIAPTFVRTPINSFQLDDPIFYKALTDRVPARRIGTEKDIAAAAVFLCSDGAAFVNGHILGVDGGLTAMQ